MALFPKVDSPCPYKDSLLNVMDGDICRMCKREVFEISFMTDVERADFLASCKTEVCVSYDMRAVKQALRPALTAALAGSAGLAMAGAASAQEDYSDYIIVGGIKDPTNVEMIEDQADQAIPELPIIYEKKSTPLMGQSQSKSNSAKAKAVAKKFDAKMQPEESKKDAPQDTPVRG